MVTRRGFLFAAAAMKPQKLETSMNRFASHYNKWVKGLANLSPHSPDYAAQVAAAFHEQDLGNLFRAVERML